MQGNFDSASKLWDLANLVTGFAAAQGLAFAYASVQKDFAQAINSPWVRVLIAILVILFSSGYWYAVWWCHKKVYEDQHAGASSQDKQTSWRVTKGRIACIVAFGLLSLLAALGPLMA